MCFVRRLLRECPQVPQRLVLFEPAMGQVFLSSSSSAPVVLGDSRGLQAGRRIPRLAAQTAKVLDLTRDVKQVESHF